MVATVIIRESNGAGPVVTEITNTNWGSADTVNISDTASVPITAGAGAASFEKWQRLNVIINTSDRVGNVRVFRSSGTDVGNVSLVTSASEMAYTSPVFATPEANTLESDFLMTTSTPAGTNVNIAGTLLASLEANGDSDYVVHVLEVGASATTGPSPAWNLSWLYDEVT